MENQPRRDFVKGAAWSVPVIVATTTLPAYVTSPRPMIDGWVNNRTSCYTGKENMLHEIDGRGTYPTRGLWISGVTSTAKITNVKFTQYVSTVAGKLTSEWELLVNGLYLPMMQQHR